MNDEPLGPAEDEVVPGEEVAEDAPLTPEQKRKLTLEADDFDVVEQGTPVTPENIREEEGK